MNNFRPVISDERKKYRKQSLGKAGEDFAAKQIQKEGLNVLNRNYRCPKGEMDIIAQDGKELIFIEVRTRSSGYRGWGEESMTKRKLLRLQSIAAYYIKEQGFQEWPAVRFDLFAIRWDNDESADIKCNWIRGIG